MSYIYTFKFFPKRHLCIKNYKYGDGVKFVTSDKCYRNNICTKAKSFPKNNHGDQAHIERGPAGSFGLGPWPNGAQEYFL
jgi:hypothetical protein